MRFSSMASLPGLKSPLAGCAPSHDLTGTLERPLPLSAVAPDQGFSRREATIARSEGTAQ